MTLSKRQQQVCDLIVKGMTNKEIAASIGINRRTVESHRVVVFEKTGVRNAIELTRKILGAS